MAQVLFDPSQVLGSPWALIGRLHQAVQQAASLLESQHHPRLGLVCDLDDTAFNTAFRTARLFQTFIASVEPLEGMTAEELSQEVWELAAGGNMPYSVSSLLDGKLPPAVSAAWFQFWRNHFFTNQAVKSDLPQGVIRSLLQLAVRKGLSVGYLTGRHLPGRDADPFPAGMVEGTLHTLWKYDFPHGSVVFKPNFRLADVDFKGAHFVGCLGEEAQGTISVGYMDNEPGMVNLHDQVMSRLNLPHVSVWVQTVHAPLKEDLLLAPNVLVLKPS